MKYLLFTVCVCVCFTQIYSDEAGQTKYIQELKESCASAPDVEPTVAELEQDRATFKSIKDISSQALEDFKKITKKICLMHILLDSILCEMLIRDLNAEYTRINPEDTEEYIGKYGAEGCVKIDVIKELEKVPSPKLEPEIRTRVISFMKGFFKDATIDQIKASFTYLYGTA